MPVATTAAGEQAWNAAALGKRPEAPRFRVWTWPRPAIVLGRSQRNRLDEVRARAGQGIEVVARDSGGGAVLAGPWMIAASVALPPDHHLLGTGLIDAYRWLGELHKQLLSRIGVSAELVAPDRVRETSTALATEPVQWACYGSLSPWEVVDARGRKLVGLAQQRRRDAILLVSGLLMGTPPWQVLCRALDGEADHDRLAARTTSVESMTGEAVEAGSIQRAANALEELIGEAVGEYG